MFCDISFVDIFAHVDLLVEVNVFEAFGEDQLSMTSSF